MGRIAKTVFVSYRRLDFAWARLIFGDLTEHGYDVFLDLEDIASGSFEDVILGEIKAKAHFLVLLTPTALERCGDSGDLFRREIEAAIGAKRNIVPIMLDGFDFGSPGIDGGLWDKLATLKGYNGLPVPPKYFTEAMDRLREEYLNVPLDAVPHPVSQGRGPVLRLSASANTVCARHEGATELMGDVFLRCTNDADTPYHGPSLLVTLSTSAPITSLNLERGVTEVVLFEVGRPGANTLIRGVESTSPGPYTVMFSGVEIDGIRPNEARTFQISNLRCDCSTCPVTCDGIGFVYAFVTMTGTRVENAHHTVATVRRGLEFEARSADNLGRLPDSGFEVSRSANLTEGRIATLRFTEGFVNAFKSRVPTLARIWTTYKGDAVSTGESGAICAVFGGDGGAAHVAGLADCGTRLGAMFFNLQAGVRIFVSARELGSGSNARLLDWESPLSPGEAIMIGDLEVKELPIKDRLALAIWEIVPPFYSGVNSLDFTVFASYVSDPVANLPSIGTSIVQGSFYPAIASYPHPSCGPIPVFLSSLYPSLYNIFTVVP